MKINKVTITPADAERMLKLNTSNRPVNWNHVRYLAREMSLGRWKLNGDTICMSDAKLIDGQHRLLAIIQSGVTIQAMLVEGLASDVFDTKDVGRRRSASDTLAVRGEVETKNLAAALAVVDKYLTGRMNQCVRYSNADIEELLENHPGVRESIGKTRETKKLLPKSVLTGCHYLFAQKDQDAADKFVSSLISGKDLNEGDAIYLLRERLMNNALAKAKLRAEYIMALLIKAWNYCRVGASVRQLRFRQEGDCPESFPIVQ